MSAIDIDKAIESAVEIVREAHDKHKLQELTKAKVREEVEQKLRFEAGVLDEKPYKKRINEIVAATVEELRARKSSDSGDGQTKEEGVEEHAKPSPPGKERKSKSNNTGDTASKKRKPKSSDAAALHQNDKDNAKGKKKNRKGSEESRVSKEKERTFSNGKVSSKEIVKSMEFVASDGEGESVPNDMHVSSGSTSSTKRKGKRAIVSDIEDKAESNTSPKRRRKSEDDRPGPKKAPESGATKKTSIDEPEEEKVDGKPGDSETKSDSELSVLIDETPTRKKKESKQKSRGKSEKKSRSKKETKDVSSSEEQIKKLKSFVVACGVRKVWSKELKDCETPSSQIAHLRELLTDLGMRGRFSLEQAKAIKAKRDLEKEMADVQEFAQRYAGDRPKRSVQKPSVVDASSDEECEDAHPSRRPRTAHQSIMDFLGDQSDSD